MTDLQELKKKALKIVCFLIAGKLQENTFLRCLNHLDQAYYDDVVEERVINKICGYSLCDKELINSKITDKKFFIDCRSNKYFDITERKKFCSNFCCAASQHIKGQLKTDLYSESALGTSAFNLLVETPQKVHEEQQTLIGTESNSKFNMSFSKAISCPTGKNEPKLSLSSAIPNAFQLLDQNLKPKKTNTKTFASVNQKKNIDDIEKTKFNNGNIKTEIKGKRRKDAMEKYLSTIEKCIFEWVTIKTYKFLYGEDIIVEKLKHFQLLQNENNESKLNEGILDKSNSYKLSSDNSQQMNTSKAFNNKVKYFLEGRKENVNKYNADYNLETSEEIIYTTTPTTTSVQRKRYEIFVKLLCADKSLSSLGIISRNNIENLKSLVKTFNLQSHNVIFEPTDFKIIKVMLLKILCIRDAELKKALEGDVFRGYVKLICDEGHLDRLLQKIENINLFFKNSKKL